MAYDLTIQEMNEIRDSLKLSFSDIANASNVPPATVQKVLAGETKKPRSETWASLQEAMDRFRAVLLAKDEASAPAKHRAESKDTRPLSDSYTLKDYYALPEDAHKELIDGCFYDLSSPTFGHQNAVVQILFQIKKYIMDKKGSCIPICAPFDVQLDRDEYTMVQPDLMIVCDSNKIRRNCLYGAPDFVVEIISRSTKKKDMIVKSAKYEKAGVREYWMVDLDGGRVLVCDYEHEERFTIYGTEDEIPVGIYDGDLKLNLRDVFEQNIE